MRQRILGVIQFRICSYVCMDAVSLEDDLATHGCPRLPRDKSDFTDW